MHKFRFVLLVFVFFRATAQDVVNWQANFSKENSEIIITATIEKGWHLYSQYISVNAGPIPTKISFTKNKCFKLKGKPKEENLHALYDENFMAHLAVFDEKAIFRQKIKVKKNCNIEFSINFMVCDNTRCLPPKDEKLTLNIQK